MSLEKEFHGPNLGYVLQLYEQYRIDPNTVDETTRKLFAQWSPAESESAALTPARDLLAVTKAANLAQAIRLYGYLSANLDPLDNTPADNPLLTLEFYKLEKEDLLNLPADVLNLPGREDENAFQAIEALRSIYCGTTGYDYGHIRIPEERDWLFQAAETGIERTIATGVFNPALPQVDGVGSVDDGNQDTEDDGYITRTLPRGNTAAPPGYSEGEFSAEHFEIRSTGTSLRDASATHTQGLFILAPAGN